MARASRRHHKIYDPLLQLATRRRGHMRSAPLRPPRRQPAARRPEPRRALIGTDRPPPSRDGETRHVPPLPAAIELSRTISTRSDIGDDYS